MISAQTSIRFRPVYGHPHAFKVCDIMSNTAMAKNSHTRQRQQSRFRVVALALLISVFAPAFCSLGLFALQTVATAPAGHSGCHDSAPGTPSAPAPGQQCCSIAPAQAPPSARYLVPAPMIAGTATNDFLLRPEPAPAMPVLVLMPDSSPPQQVILRI